MRFEGTKTAGWESAIIGMRLPYSKDYSDAVSKVDSTFYENGEPVIIGKSDMKIIKALIGLDEAGDKVGAPNSKFLQMIEIWVSIEAPLAFWKEFDTYRHMVKNSTSTMHRIQKYEIDMECFEPNPLNSELGVDPDTVKKLENARKAYNETGDKTIWYYIIGNLPDAWLQTRMCHFNYATLQNMMCWRNNHKQNCWSGKDNPSLENFMSWAKALPYVKDFFGVE